MSPEQIEGGEVDQQTDIWSLGVVLYEMIAGKLPFRGHHDSAVIYSILNDEPEPLYPVRKGIPKSIQQVFSKATAKDWRDRYHNAEEMLADGRGRLVPFRDAEALSAEVNDLLDNEIERHAMRKRAYDFSRKMIWQEVAGRYLELFADVKNERERKPRPVFYAKTERIVFPELPKPHLGHLKLMTDDVGILQHAKFVVPDRTYGYCTDDNARAVIAMTRYYAQYPEPQALKLLDIYLSFIMHSQKSDGSMRNFMNFNRSWQEDEPKSDAFGRVLWAFGTIMAKPPTPA